jgi:putative ABC transport system permease protein
MARKVLVVFQFTISISLIVGTLMIFEQINYLRNAELGFRKDNIIMLQVDRTDIVAKYDSFKSEILPHTNILSVTSLDDIIGAGHNTHEFRPEGVPENEWRFYPALVVKHDFAKTFDIEILAGRDYDESFSTDPVSGMLISESMVKHLGWESNEAALGKKFRSLQGEEKVIGVFRDFQATSLHEEAGPFVLNMKEMPSMINYFTNYVAIRIGEGDLDETLAFLATKWSEFEDYRPFSYFMLEDELSDLYKDEENLGILSLIITILILFIAALGLFGLASFMAEKRTKEISIRKVMGASTGNIFILLSSEFIRLILISMIVSWPVAYLLADNFFKDQFIIQAGLNIWILVVSGLAAILLTVLITMYRAYRAAKTDPAKTLKYE